MDEEVRHAFWEEWLFRQIKHRPDNPVVTPDKTYHYVGGYRLGSKQTPQRLIPPPKQTEPYRGAHP